MNPHVKKEIKAITVIAPIICLLFVAFLIVWTFLKPDYKGSIQHIGSDNFSLEPRHVDPEASYATYEIHFDKNTRVIGKGNSIDDLREGQVLRVWSEEVNQNTKAKYIFIVSQ